MGLAVIDVEEKRSVRFQESMRRSKTRLDEFLEVVEPVVEERFAEYVGSIPLP